MIQVETHLYCSPPQEIHPGHYWIDLVVDGKVIKTVNVRYKDEIDSYNKQLEKYANKHKELIKNMLVADIKLDKFNELYHIKKLSSKKWKDTSNESKNSNK